MRVLVVDDNDLLREMTADVLRRRGHDVVVASDGEAGLRTALEWGPDVVVCDHDMPRMTGTEVFQALPPHLRERFVLWTGADQPDFPEQGRVLMKPCNVVELLAKIGRVTPAGSP